MTFYWYSAGHYGLFETTGKFSISGDTLFVKSFKKQRKKTTHVGILDDTLKIQGDSCLLELSENYEYCKREVFKNRTAKVKDNKVTDIRKEDRE